MATVVLLGTLDTKGTEFDFVRASLRNAGCDVVLVDVGVAGVPQVQPDIGAEAVAAAAGETLDGLRAADDRGRALDAMGRGATALTSRLYVEGRLDCLLSLGGSGGSSIATSAMRALPIGVPKLMVSTIASGDVGSYVGQSDIAMMYAVLDVSGLNAVSRRIFCNAAAAAAGMAALHAARVAGPPLENRPAVALTMFGVTTPAATTARRWLEDQGYDVLVFHANGAGGRSMEKLVADGVFAGVLDLTTTELADELVGGDLSAGPDRLEAAGRLGLPQVVSLGALDMVNFGPVATVPARLRDRLIYKHNNNVTLVRTTAAENAELGRTLARKLNAARGPAAVFIPRSGVSSIDEPGKVFHDPAADAALFDALTGALSPAVEVVSLEAPINDPAFATAMARKLHDLIIIYNSGRFRMAGRGSIAGLMPYGDANQIVTEMAADVLPVVKTTPVLAGVCGTDPFREMPRFLRQLKDMGFSGVQNFPTVGLFEGRIRANMEETGMGYDKEVEMIRLAGEIDMITTPYVFNADEARAMTKAKADIIVAHVGTTLSGTIGAHTVMTLDESVERVQEMADAAKSINPDVLVICHGGPIATVEDTRYVLGKSRGLAGFYGASSMERLPVEVAITENVRSFKALQLNA